MTREVMLVILCGLILARFANWRSWMSQRCVMCGAVAGQKHHRNCPWGRRLG